MRPDIVNLSRRGLVRGAVAGALMLGLRLPRAHAVQASSFPQGSAKGRNVAAFLTVNANDTITLRSPFAEMGQGIYTAIAQIVAEELDAELSAFRMEQAPAGDAWKIMFGDTARFTGASQSMRSSFTTFRILGATARAMLMQAAATRWAVPVGELTTEPGRVVHAPSKRARRYALLAPDAAALAPPADVKLRDPGTFRLIGTPQKRKDARSKSTGRAQYGIDTRLPGMRYAAVVHSPRYGDAVTINETAARAMPGVMSVRRVPGGVAVVADSFWRARQAVTALEITWSQGTMASDFSSDFQLARMKRGFARPGAAAEEIGAQPPLQAAARVIEAEYDAPYLAHATMEPQNATARFNPDGTLDVWVGNQGPDFFAAGAAEAGGVALDKVTIHTPYLGGGFGRRLYYGMEATTQAVLLAKAEGAPVKVVWHREEDFARDHFRPLSTAKLRAGLDAKGVLTGLDITAVGEGPMGRHNAAALANPAVDESVVEGLTAKPYAIANRRVGYVKVRQPPSIGFWRSVGHSANAFFYECFLDEIAAAGGKDPLEFRLSLLRDARRQEAVLKAVVELAGGWKTQSYEVDGASRALGVAMSSAYGTEVAVIAEISASAGEVTVHHVWIAVDPGSVVNPALVVAQMQSGVAMGCSIALLEQVTFHDGWIEQGNFDTYPFLSPDRMPQVHVRILESGAPMGGIGETGVPAVVPAIVNAVATLTGQRVRTLPLSKTKIGQA